MCSSHGMFDKKKKKHDALYTNLTGSFFKKKLKVVAISFLSVNTFNRNKDQLLLYLQVYLLVDLLIFQILKPVSGVHALCLIL